MIVERPAFAPLASQSILGETRLALEVAAALEEAYSDGTLVVDLADVREEGVVAQSIAGALGLAEVPGRP